MPFHNSTRCHQLLQQKPQHSFVADWKSDNELFTLVKDRLYTPVVGDILDRMGLTHQFLQQAVQPLLAEMKVAGRAMPALIPDHAPQRACSAPWHAGMAHACGWMKAEVQTLGADS